MKYSGVTIFLFSFFLLFSFVCGGEENQRPPVIVKADADRTTVTIGDIIIYSVIINKDPRVELETSDLNSTLTAMKGLEVINMGTKGPDSVEGRLIIKKWYKLRVGKTGSYIIPSVTVRYKTGKTSGLEARTSKIFIEVKSVIKEGEEVTDIRDIKSLMAIKRDLVQFILIAAALFVLTVIAIYRLRKRKRPNIPIEPEIPAHEQAMKELSALKDKRLIKDGRIKAFYFELSEIFRRYLERRFDFPAVDWTTEEIVPHLNRINELQTGLAEESSILLSNSDKVKFAKFIPGHDEPESEMDRAVSFINATIPVSTEENK